MMVVTNARTKQFTSDENWSRDTLLYLPFAFVAQMLERTDGVPEGDRVKHTLLVLVFPAQCMLQFAC